METKDLKLMLDFIDLVAERGAIKGKELTVIGSLRYKVEQEIENPPSTEPLPNAENAIPGIKVDNKSSKK